MGFLDSFTPQELENAQGFSNFQAGDNTARISEVEEAQSKNYNDMLVVHFENDSGAKIRYYIIDNEYKLQKLKALYQAFNIPYTEKDYNRWIGRKGIVVCKEGKPYNGETRPEVNYVKPLPSKNPAGGSASGSPARPPAPAASKPPAPEPSGNADDDGFQDDIPF
ncbi:MAG: hypothetical protein LBK08_01595 [Treponema sp.]|jgi:hypothetical protein|nr:hypothetical protein [Treponema sp.]